MQFSTSIQVVLIALLASQSAAVQTDVRALELDSRQFTGGLSNVATEYANRVRSILEDGTERPAPIHGNKPILPRSILEDGTERPAAIHGNKPILPRSIIGDGAVNAAKDAIGNAAKKAIGNAAKDVIGNAAKNAIKKLGARADETNKARDLTVVGSTPGTPLNTTPEEPETKPHLQINKRVVDKPLEARKETDSDP